MAYVQEIMRHAGRYRSKKNAESLASYLRSQGEEVTVVPFTSYDVMVITKEEVPD